MVARKSLLVRIWNYLFGKAHSVMDAIEDKIDIMEEKIVSLKQAYAIASEGLVKVSALEIKYRGKAKKSEIDAAAYHTKADQLATKMSSGEIPEEDAKKHIVTMLNKEEQMKKDAVMMTNQADNQKKITDDLALKIKSMKELITKSENQISTLRVQKETAEVNKNVSKELSSVNMDGITSHIEDVENEIESNNAEATAWMGLDESLESDEERINKLLDSPSATDDSVLLENFLKGK